MSRDFCVYVAMFNFNGDYVESPLYTNLTKEEAEAKLAEIRHHPGLIYGIKKQDNLLKIKEAANKSTSGSY